jgi:hypothetical protein
MASQIDDTIPADNVKAEKSAFRQNFNKAKTEITELQRKTRLPYKLAFGDQSL